MKFLCSFQSCCKRNVDTNIQLKEWEKIYYSAIYSNIIQPFCQWSVDLPQLVDELTDYLENTTNIQYKKLVKNVISSFDSLDNSIQIKIMIIEDLDSMLLDLQKTYEATGYPILLTGNPKGFLTITSHIEKFVYPEHIYVFTNGKSIKLNKECLLLLKQLVETLKL